MSATTTDVEATRNTTPPTLDDARRVADAFIDAGVAEVLVYGSVARGDATAHSDIDFVAIFDDLDYSTRHAKARELCGIARAVAGRRCDVTVTDYCEWAWRTKRVSASFEHQIAPECVRLAKTPKKCVFDARKPIGMPDTNLAEATSRIREWIVGELVTIQNALAPTVPELEAVEREDDERQALYRGGRNEAICLAVALVVEKALKIGVQLQGEYPVSDKEFKEMGHDIAKPLAQLTGVFGERLADDHVRTGVTVVTLLLAELRAAGSTHPDVGLAADLTRELWSRYRVTSPLDGEPRAVPLEERPWEAVSR